MSDVRVPVVIRQEVAQQLQVFAEQTGQSERAVIDQALAEFLAGDVQRDS